eukprot:TRINITY_DN6634_c0_g1_i1.p2 TRINITY_DN6634_c0_g1~~TRINITY_DN6634_c0_g1_i1.p2  ORF type:complete len:104 (-),score=21.06 TRINITY_DN6634_c0_g1_i1:20-331(-)
MFDVFELERLSVSLPICVACTKSDLDVHRTPDQLKRMLKKEIETLRATRRSAVERQGEEGQSKERAVGVDGQSFEFEHLENPVTFLACSITKPDPLVDWILEN